MSSTINFNNASSGNNSIMDTLRGDTFPVSRRSFLDVQAHSVLRFPSDSSTTAFTGKRKKSETPQDPEIDRSDARAQEGTPRAKRRKIERTCVVCEETKTDVHWYKIEKGSGSYKCHSCYQKNRRQNHQGETERTCVVCGEKTTSDKFYKVEKGSKKGSGSYQCDRCYRKQRRQNHQGETERTCVVCEKTTSGKFREVEKGSGSYRCNSCYQKNRRQNHPKGKIGTVS